MPLYDRVRSLPLHVEEAELEPLVVKDAPGRSLITLHGGGETGLGEDVTYEPQSPELGVDLIGEFTLESFSGSLPALPGYRRWGVESAAFDLALRQAGLSVAEALGRKSARALQRIFEVAQRLSGLSPADTETLAAALKNDQSAGPGSD